MKNVAFRTSLHTTRRSGNEARGGPPTGPRRRADVLEDPAQERGVEALGLEVEPRRIAFVIV